MKHEHFETRVEKLQNLEDFDAPPEFAPRISIKPGKWMWVADKGELLRFPTEAEALRACDDLHDQNANG